MLFEIIKKYVPYLQENNNKEPFTYLYENIEKPKIKIQQKPILLNYTDNANDVVLTSVLMWNLQCTKEYAENLLYTLSKQNLDFKNNLVNIILTNKEKRELEQVTFQFQIPISFSILTHLTRHRMHSLLIPDFVPIWDLENYIIPDSIKKRAKNKYEQIFKNNLNIYNEFKNFNIAEEELIYFYLGGHMCNVFTTMNASTLQWICRLRCCNKAQWQIRQIAKEMVNQVKEVAPLIAKGLGPACQTDRICYEGKESCMKENKDSKIIIM